VDVGRTPSIPHELTRRPFTLDEARNAGLTLSALSGKAWQRVGAELYRWNELPEDPWQTLSAWRRILPPETVFFGASAAWLHGLDLEPTNPVEVAVPASSGLRSRAGLVVRRCEIPPAEVVHIRRLRATTLPLTLAGLCLHRPAVEALVAIDMAVHMRLTDSAALGQYAVASMGRPGVARLRSLALLAAPAESPMETRLRWLLIHAGLRQPQVQTNLHDSAARFVGRADLYYPDARLVIEYEGGTHRDRMVDDNRRQNLLVNSGYWVLRFTSADIHNRADVVVAQVQAALKGPFGARHVKSMSSKARLAPNMSNSGSVP
jgi:very-short-patch-repair endonuclease